MIESIKMDFDAVDRIRRELNDNHYFQYILHKRDHPEYTWKEAESRYRLKLPPMRDLWPYPDEWLASYWMYYELNGQYLKDARILDIGPSYNLYSIWSIITGSQSVHGVEPDVQSYKLGQELIELRGMKDRITVQNMDVETFIPQYDGTSYDVVMLGDVFGYFTDGIGVLDFIRNQVKAKYIFLETNVVDTDEPYTPGRIPSRKVMQELVKEWNILFYYDYKDFKGRGEGAGAVAGLKEFYVLQQP